ncbi:MAG: dephospho-CoA kinase [Bacteroidetes bacterium]|nr:MAG: dephospho-CoA kinase [Bacteroidota bacterium]
MIKLGLTGGIGSGKSTVAKVFQELGVPVYYADVEAKKFLLYKDVKQQLSKLFGRKILAKDGEIDKSILADIVFTNEKELVKLNALIHPMLENDFLQWSAQNSDAKYIVKEAAILFEAGFDKSVDKILTISAAAEERITRVITRDHTSKQQVLDRISKQWTDVQREDKSDYIIHNSNGDMILEKIIKIHEELNV